MRQLFLDLDGVLADFDGYYESQFGIRPTKDIVDPPGFWDPVKAYGGAFFRHLPPMQDARDLWLGAKRLHPNPIILTGVPWSIPFVEDHKRDWVKHHISPLAQVIACASKDKRKHGKPGDILIDDWHKYRHLWEEMGGVFILHTSAVDSLKKAGALYAQA